MSGASRNTTAFLLASTALVSLIAAGPAFAQDTDPAAGAAESDRVVVRGAFIPDYNIQGDSDIAAALTRVTGISLASGKFVYVRGLNERYSNVTLNGSPLPSPEPLRRIAPLDMFPTSLLSSTVVQKTFSPEYSGEFGGGLIAMSTAVLPDEDFFEIDVSTGFELGTTMQRGLTYMGGGDDDYTGFDDGTRNIPEPLAAVFGTQRVGNSMPVAQQEEIGRSLVNSPLWVMQRIDNIEPNFGVGATGGKILSLGNVGELGILASGGYSNEWTNRTGLTGQGALGAGEFAPQIIAERTSTEQEIGSNALLSLGFDVWNDHEITLTALGTRSTLKGARSSNVITGGAAEGGIIDFDRRDKLDWFERQLWMTQATGTHVFPALNALEVSWRTSYAEAFRDAPYQREVSYRCLPVTTPGAPTDRAPDCDATPSSSGPNEFAPGFYAYGGRQSDNLTQFSKVEDISRDYGLDLSLPVTVMNRDIELKAGTAWTNQNRDAFLRQFRFAPGGAGLPRELLFSRVDYIFSDPNITDSRLRLVETGGLGFPEAYQADLEVMAYYAGLDAQVTDFIRLAVGGRFEESDQTTDTFNKTLPDNGVVESALSEDYFLPAATLTWNFADDLQLRLAASKTITRPQFRELAFAEFFDTETEQNFRGNPFLVNTEVENFDARLEYYFGRDQFVTGGMFYKDMEAPIEEFALALGDSIASSFINVPSAVLWGGEVEFEKVIPVQDWFGLQWSWLDDKAIVFKTNYTYTNSEVSADGTVTLANQANLSDIVPDVRDASGFVTDGRMLQGASEHLFNLQLGWRGETSSFNVLVNYASERIRQSEDLANGLPAVMEEPPISLDAVYIHNFELRGGEYELGVEVNNILGEDYEAYQEALGVKVPVDTYDRDQSISLSLKRRF
jgi:TonB-dependent receptor